MFRTPPRKEPRVAGIALGRGLIAVVILDPWEVRAAVVTRDQGAAKTLLLREAPEIVVTAKPLPRWLGRIPGAKEIRQQPGPDLPIGRYAELRRFAGTREEALVRKALTLAEETMTATLHDRISQN